MHPGGLSLSALPNANAVQKFKGNGPRAAKAGCDRLAGMRALQFPSYACITQCRAEAHVKLYRLKQNIRCNKPSSNTLGVLRNHLSNASECIDVFWSVVRESSVDCATGEIVLR
jgi:hypothetical protein